jgi:hypothetical protein
MSLAEILHRLTYLPPILLRRSIEHTKGFHWMKTNDHEPLSINIE